MRCYDSSEADDVLRACAKLCSVICYFPTGTKYMFMCVGEREREIEQERDGEREKEKG